MATVSITVPNGDASDVLAALEKQWSKEASRINPDYSSLNPTQRAQACIVAFLRSITHSYRRERARAEAQAAVANAGNAEVPPDVT